jgi:hydroxymethylbilane synthase
MDISYPLRIGTRGSPLALAQASETRSRLVAAYPLLAGDGMIEIIVIRTTGDAIQDRPLLEIGGKGLFTKEIDEALLDRRIDIAVNSMKDVPTWLPDGIVVAALLEREDVRDAFISIKARDIAGLAAGSVVGTSSLRRQAQILHTRPDLTVVPLRGNVETRLGKLAAGECDATLLAVAGLVRLGRVDAITSFLSTEAMLPAVAQGAIGITSRTDDVAAREFLDAINHRPTAVRVAAERAFLEALDGSCNTPIGGLAAFESSDTLRLRGLVVTPDGVVLLQTTRKGPVADAVAMGRDAGKELLQRAGPRFFTVPPGPA